MAEAITYISPAHEAMKPFAERPAKDEKQEHGAMVGIPADVLNTYKPPLSEQKFTWRRKKRGRSWRRRRKICIGTLPSLRRKKGWRMKVKWRRRLREKREHGKCILK